MYYLLVSLENEGQGLDFGIIAEGNFEEMYATHLKIAKHKKLASVQYIGSTLLYTGEVGLVNGKPCTLSSGGVNEKHHREDLEAFRKKGEEIKKRLNL